VRTTLFCYIISTYVDIIGATAIKTETLCVTITIPTVMYTPDTFFVMAFTAIFVIVNPIGNVMVFLSLTEEREKRRGSE
jgi:hypothetical protein